METDAVELLKNGSIVIHIDDDKITWRPPRVRHMETARNEHQDITDLARKGLANLAEAVAGSDDEPSTDPEIKAAEALGSDAAAEKLNVEVREACAAWVRARHADLVLSGSLPEDVLDWPVWLPRLSFLTACTRHWGTNPFGSKNG